MQHVCHALRRMVNVALQVHERRSLLEDTVAVALFQRVHERLLVLVALMDVHVVADADDVSHEGNHVRGLADGLAVCDLGLLLVEDLLLEAEEVAGGGEGEAGTGGVIAEEGDAEAGVEDLRGLVALPQVAQSVGYGKDSVDFVVGLVPGPVEVGLVHVVDAQGFQMSCKLNSFAHDFSPYLSLIYSYRFGWADRAVRPYEGDGGTGGKPRSPLRYGQDGTPPAKTRGIPDACLT